MIVASARIEQRHHWDSVWYEWMLNLRGILYYSRDAGHTYTETVYLLGNPLVIWPVLAALCLVVVMLFFYGRYRTDPLFELPQRYSYFVAASTFCFLAYWLNLLPYLAVRRSSFIYHYSEWRC
jgi:dolichyl-phosphate-mannose--protein O-mannosyl transferase